MVTELTRRYARNTPDLVSAWRFVMAHLDLVGPDPSISITPVWSDPRTFDVSVSGTVEITTTEEDDHA